MKVLFPSFIILVLFSSCKTLYTVDDYYSDDQLVEDQSIEEYHNVKNSFSDTLSHEEIMASVILDEKYRYIVNDSVTAILRNGFELDTIGADSIPKERTLQHRNNEYHHLIQSLEGAFSVSINFYLDNIGNVGYAYMDEDRIGTCDRISALKFLSMFSGYKWHEAETTRASKGSYQYKINMPIKR